jgi:hypothetical protein
MKKDFRFSDEDRKLLYDHIRGRFGPKKATGFVDWLQVRCSTFVFLNSKGDRKANSLRLETMINNFKLSQKYLNEIGISFDPYPQRTFADTRGAKPFSIKDLHYFLNESRKEVFCSLQKVIDILETALTKQPLRAPLKGKTSSFIQCIAEDYETILKEKPTIRKGNHFFQFIQILFLTLKLPSKNPIRAIKEALKARK